MEPGRLMSAHQCVRIGVARLVLQDGDEQGDGLLPPPASAVQLSSQAAGHVLSPDPVHASPLPVKQPSQRCAGALFLMQRTPPQSFSTAG